MDEIRKQFSEFLVEENKEDAVMYILEKLQNKEIDVLELYSNVITPVLNEINCDLEERNLCIWKEHVRTAIARTIVESCFPFVLAKRSELQMKKKGIAVVLCPPEEYHDLGARMAADFFTICGYQAIYVGSNTPYEDFYNAIDVIRPEIVAISVGNYYNLVVTKKIIKDIREKINYPCKILVGGTAFSGKEENCKLVGADLHVVTFEDIKKIAET